MIHSRATVIEIFKLRAEYRVSVVALDAATERAAILAQIEWEMFGALKDMAHTFAVELDRQDVHYWQHAKNERDITFRANWCPVTESVEMFDHGMHDGTLWQHQGAPVSKIRVRDYMNPQYTPPADEPMNVPYVERIFAMDGWDETRRLWIYREER